DLDPHLVVEILAQSLDTKASAEMRWTPLEAARLEKLATAKKPVEEVARNYDMMQRLASQYFFGGLEGLKFSKAEEAALCAVGAQMLSLEAAEKTAGRGQTPGDRRNDVASRLRSVSKEIAFHLGALDMECLLTVAPREQ
ncbi:unnamed protein product, partial [Effrenium voratum]